MSEKPLHEMSEDERARYYEEHMDDDTLFSKTPRATRPRRGTGPSTMFSLRMTGEELTKIAVAAKERGMTVSDFIRKASMAAVEDDDAASRAVALGEAKEKARELREALSRL